MKTKLFYILRDWPIFILFLPVFFMLHVLNENFAPGLGSTVLKLVLLYMAIALVFASLFFLLLKDIRKAAVVSFFLLSFNFFFGSLHDGLKQMAGEQSFLVKYIFIIPFVVMLTILLVIGLKRTKKDLSRAYMFLNILLLVFIAMELAELLPKTLRKNLYDPPPLVESFVSCDTCKRPDVYVIIADEYAGKEELADIFSFDNTAFEKELLDRNFHIINNSTSNYNATAYSTASLFNMDYLKLSDNKKVTQADLLLCRSIINNSNAGQFFLNKGYTIKNYSFFDLQGERNSVLSHYFQPKLKLLSSQTFHRRFAKEAGFNFFSVNQNVMDQKKDYYNNFTNDEKIDSLTKRIVLEKNDVPKLIYSHFARPHAPFYFDREGKPFVYEHQLQGLARKRHEYKEYLMYTNQRLLDLVDHILKYSSKAPVILLASDHGYRLLEGEADKRYNFMNLCAVYLPNGKYDGFYDGMSTVNTFRGILNNAFGQQLPRLKDSTNYFLLAGGE